MSIKADNFTISHWNGFQKGVTKIVNEPEIVMKIVTEYGIIFLQREHIVKIERYKDKRKH